MNTHSREGDCRMEVLAAASVRNQVPYPVLEEILQCVTTEEAVRKLDACGKKDAVMQDLLSKIMFYLNKRAAGKLQIEVILYSNEFGELAGAGHGGPIYHIGRKYLGIAVLGMGIQIIVDYGALKAGAQAPVYREAGAGYLACGGKIQYAQVLTYVPMRLGLKVELRGL